MEAQRVDVLVMNMSQELSAQTVLLLHACVRGTGHVGTGERGVEEGRSSKRRGVRNSVHEREKGGAVASKPVLEKLGDRASVHTVVAVGCTTPGAIETREGWLH